MGLDFDQVLYCMNKSSVGDNEMATLGYLTTNYDPPINIIPAVAFNWVSKSTSSPYIKYY